MQTDGTTLSIAYAIAPQEVSAFYSAAAAAKEDTIMGSLYDTTMKREKMIHDFEQLLAQYRAYFKDADIDIDGNAPELMLYKEALRIYTSLPQMKNIDPLCILEGEYDLLRSILSDMQTGNWITSPYYKKDAI
ncbi:MAG: hypothetical protein SOY71_03660 [Dialister sp.]|nr:hypothetical protein [Dialister sp.]MDY3744009.1 hypothetical protein [Dialister sp.]MDY4074197.1 hypothetical protein [Dialister sp.]MDY4958440.1 hypothetical protein [Dialister sp.]MDY6116269.1 hypothetical protein [Dialister sp.]